MTLSKSARYALYASLEMAAAGDRRVTVADVARPYHIPQAALAKVLQQLVRAGLAVGTRGVGGGYQLARPGKQVTVLEVISVFDPPRPRSQCALSTPLDPPCRMKQSCSIRVLFDEIDEVVRGTLESVTLATLAGRVERQEA
jgi:Rrf2 family protein